jgi:hypothetical protein
MVWATRGGTRQGTQAALHRSLVLFNESLASTNPGESLYIAQDIVCILRRLGAPFSPPTCMNWPPMWPP